MPSVGVGSSVVQEVALAFSAVLQDYVEVQKALDRLAQERQELEVRREDMRHQLADILAATYPELLDYAAERRAVPQPAIGNVRPV